MKANNSCKIHLSGENKFLIDKSMLEVIENTTVTVVELLVKDQERQLTWNFLLGCIEGKCMAKTR